MLQVLGVLLPRVREPPGDVLAGPQAVAGRVVTQQFSRRITRYGTNPKDVSHGPWHDRLVTSFAALHDMTGKVAVVTGGSRGIGRAIVQTLAEAGADVVIASRKLDACEAAAEQVRASTGRQAVAIACHVGRWGDCERLIAERNWAAITTGRRSC